MQCCFVISENTTVYLGFFRHQTSSCQHKKHGQFWQSAMENARLRKQLQAKDATFSNVQQSMTRSENNSAQRKTGQIRLSLNLTSWCAARHLLRFFSVSVALAGVWLVCFKWRWDYKHIYCNGLACSPSSLLWLVKCGLTDMELQSEALCRN